MRRQQPYSRASYLLVLVREPGNVCFHYVLPDGYEAAEAVKKACKVHGLSRPLWLRSAENQWHAEQIVGTKAQWYLWRLPEGHVELAEEAFGAPLPAARKSAKERSGR